MKNIYLVITPYFPSEDDFRGSYILDQVKALEKLSQYQIVVLKLDSKDGYYKYENIPVHTIKTYHLPSSILPGLFHHINYMKVKKLLQKNIDLKKVRFVHAHSIYPAGYLAYSLKKEYGIKAFIQYHGLSVFQENLGTLLKKRIKKFHNSYIVNRHVSIANNVDLNIGVSKKVIEYLKEKKGYLNKNNYVLYNGVDKQKFYKIDKNLRHNEFIIGCIANFWKIKNQITLLKALVKLKNKSIKIIFIGSGPDLEECQDFVKDNGVEDKVEFRKEVTHEDLNIFYNQIDLFVLPSYYEALGCVYMESMQVGKPIIAVKGQGIEELIKTEDKQYFLIEKEDVTQLINLIKYHYNHRDKEYNYDFYIDFYIKDFLHTVEEI